MMKTVLVEIEGRKKIIRFQPDGDGDLAALQQAFREAIKTDHLLMKQTSEITDVVFQMYNQLFQQNVDIEPSDTIDHASVIFALLMKTNPSSMSSHNLCRSNDSSDFNDVKEVPIPIPVEVCVENDYSSHHHIPSSNCSYESDRNSDKDASECHIPYPSPLPQFSRIVQNVANTGNLMSQYNRFVRECATFLSAKVPRPTKRDYKNFSRTLCDHFEVLKDQNCKEYYTTLRKQLARCVRNQRYQNGRRCILGKVKSQNSSLGNASLDESLMEHAKYMEKLLSSMPEGYLSVENLEQLMESSFHERRQIIDEKRPLKDILMMYPVLKSSQWIKWEYHKVTTVDEEVRRNAYEDLLSKLSEKSDLPKMSPLDHINLLLWLHSVTCNQNAPHLPIVVKKVGDLTHSSVTSESPYIEIMIDEENDITSSVIAQGIILFISCNKDIFMSVDLLLATYHVFGIRYPAAYVGFLSVLQKEILNVPIKPQSLKSLNLSKFYSENSNNESERNNPDEALCESAETSKPDDHDSAACNALI